MDDDDDNEMQKMNEAFAGIIESARSIEKLAEAAWKTTGDLFICINFDKGRGRHDIQLQGYNSLIIRKDFAAAVRQWGWEDMCDQNGRVVNFTRDGTVYDCRGEVRVLIDTLTKLTDAARKALGEEEA